MLIGYYCIEGDLYQYNDIYGGYLWKTLKFLWLYQFIM